MASLRRFFVNRPRVRHSRKQKGHDFNQGVCNFPVWLQKHLLKQQEEKKYLGKGMSESSCTHMPFFLTQTVVTVTSGMPACYSNSSETIHSLLSNNSVFSSRFDSFSEGVLESPLEKKMGVISEQMGTHLTQKFIFSRKKTWQSLQWISNSWVTFMMTIHRN